MTGYDLGDQGFNPGIGRIFFVAMTVRPGVDAVIFLKHEGVLSFSFNG
jgi:hypothetical protein